MAAEPPPRRVAEDTWRFLSDITKDEVGKGFLLLFLRNREEI